MSRNPIRLQKGLSLKQLQEKYGTECPKCGGSAHCIVGPRKLLQ